MIKGGVWKNTEDEILKAAVMKYGKNQWSRISSLLVRKSAKQCKARWYEWLDPSIKKTEWTREEDEKLLHLAKLMPTQWRTIAPIVGRTAAQCLERYEKLLDAACAKDENYDAGEDPRRLRPGEIDPNPESKPARPDPVDMDEDEKEMLSEARARLANTRGKKAKRKAREKQLEEARRLASLQKKRELKAAGLDQGRKFRKKRGIDYATEIPFEKQPQIGFFDTTGEKLDPKTAEEFLGTKGVEVSELDGKRRADIEQALRKQDMSKTQVHERHNVPGHVKHVNAMNDTGMAHKRSKLMLPAPQISERELEDIAKLGTHGALMQEELAAQATGVTRGLLNNYATPMMGSTPLRTPMRTPMAQGDSVLQEAENLYKLTQGQTPLMGGDNPDLHLSDFSGATPKGREMKTPNPLRTPLHTGLDGSTTPSGATPARTPGGPGATPSRGVGSVAGTPLRTPMRDGLNINDPDQLGAMLSEDARAEKERVRVLKSELRSGLGLLPAPKNEYQIMVPEMPEEMQDGEEPIEEDQADVEAKRAQMEKEAHEREMRKRSKAIQRELPRPLTLDGMPDQPSAREMGRAAPELQHAAQLLAAEMKQILQHDAVKYPLKKDKKPREVPPLESMEEEALREAAFLIEEEAHDVRQGMGHSEMSLGEYQSVWLACYQDILWLPSAKSYGRAVNATVTDRLESVKGDFERVRGEMEKDAKRAAKLEQKVNLLTGGYSLRAEATQTRVVEQFDQLMAAETELQVFQTLQKQEMAAVPSRMQALKEEVAKQKEREKVYQLKYENLQEQRRQMLVTRQEKPNVAVTAEA